MYITFYESPLTSGFSNLSSVRTICLPFETANPPFALGITKDTSSSEDENSKRNYALKKNCHNNYYKRTEMPRSKMVDLSRPYEKIEG